MIKLNSCTSFNCNDYNCDYCHKCSHAYYKGSATIDGRKYKWEFNPWFGPMFSCKTINKHDWLPNQRHKVWQHFDKWYNKHFCNKD